MILRKSLRLYFEIWAGSTQIANEMELALHKLNKTGYKRRMRYWFNRFRDRATAVKREEQIEKRIEYKQNLSDSQIAGDSFREWVNWVRIRKLAKRYLWRAELGLDRNTLRSGWIRWKSVVATSRQMVEI